ncbi:DUF488 domain-containing protein [Methanococcus maripaludis]|uniref:DUF488 domain-containing protein n=1 Tax=Methanococcus maripaludis OS7 TaxID=637915 RepID=A0A2Z5PG58_METMI|nr:DUF488 domain-containing protein [Methanococcus maripaludis]BAP62919.1 hypothetical protein MMOS7_08330 [Methanococcus maripaludis OS7]
MEPLKIFTIGHSKRTTEEFLKVLKAHNIGAIIDVRSVPFSRHAPQFNTDVISEKLSENGIVYFFCGKRLGAKIEDPDLYSEGIVDFEKVKMKDFFQKGLDIVEKYAKRLNVALMCSELDPIRCHRTILVSKALQDRGHNIIHLINENKIETQKDIENQMLEQYYPGGQNTLFAHLSKDKLKSCYINKNKEVGYKMR